MSKYTRFGLDRTQAEHIVDRIRRVVRAWKSRFEEFGVSGADIQRVTSAFRHINALK